MVSIVVQNLVGMAVVFRDALIPFFNIRVLSVSVKNYLYPYPVRSDVDN